MGVATNEDALGEKSMTIFPTRDHAPELNYFTAHINHFEPHYSFSTYAHA